MKFTHRMHNDFSDLRILADRIDQWSAEVNLPEDALFAIRIVLDEIVGNIIRYGGDGAAQRYEIGVSVEYEPGMLRLLIEDAGRRFDPTAVAPPRLDVDLEDRQIGGLGIHLVRRTMDTMSYRRESGHNVLQLAKRIRLTGDSIDAG